ncbi:hypothetical protein QJS66_00055 [Kocuria rhizophila]|nr:hypothetical protein QJS66_00055 [Kocuria rhizophila]
MSCTVADGVDLPARRGWSDPRPRARGLGRAVAMQVAKKVGRPAGTSPSASRRPLRGTRCEGRGHRRAGLPQHHARRRRRG